MFKSSAITNYTKECYFYVFTQDGGGKEKTHFGPKCLVNFMCCITSIEMHSKYNNYIDCLKGMHHVATQTVLI